MQIAPCPTALNIPEGSIPSVTQLTGHRRKTFNSGFAALKKCRIHCDERSGAWQRPRADTACGIARSDVRSSECSFYSEYPTSRLQSVSGLAAPDPPAQVLIDKFRVAGTMVAGRPKGLRPTAANMTTDVEAGPAERWRNIGRPETVRTGHAACEQQGSDCDARHNTLHDS